MSLAAQRIELDDVYSPAVLNPKFRPREFELNAANATSEDPEKRIKLARELGRNYDQIRRKANFALDTAIDYFLADKHESVRWGLAQGLTSATMLPERLLRKLVEDEIVVARPLLLHREHIDDDVLMQVISTCSVDHAEAIAHRPVLSDVVVCSLISTGSRDVIISLLNNRGLRLQEDQLLLIARIHFDDRDIHARLLEQERLPFQVMYQLAQQLAENLGCDVLTSKQIDDEQAVRIVASTPHGKRYRLNRPNMFDRGENDAASLEVMYRAGLLDPDRTLGFALRGDFLAFIDALALQSGCSPNRVSSLLFNIDPRCVAAICLEAGLSTPHYLAYRGVLELSVARVGNRIHDVSAYMQTLEVIRNRYDRMRNKRSVIRSLCGRH